MAIVEEIIEGEETQTERVEKLKKEGNAFFGNGEFEKAVEKYTEAIENCPPTLTDLHSILLSNSAAALIKLQKWEDAVESATKAIEIGAANEKPLERRAFAYSNISGKLENAKEDYEKLKETVPSRSAEFSRKISELDVKIDKRNEEMKQEMMGKLKDLGNLCLKPFGLSTDSFQMIPNGNGGFSVQMKNASSSQPSSDNNDQ